MDGWIGWVILVMVVAWAGRAIYEGYKRETAPPLTLVDNGHGLKEPVCPSCQTRLVTVSRKTNSGLATVFAALFILAGVIILVAVNWLAGLIALLLGVVIHHAGKRMQTVLSCPACRVDVRELD